MKIRLRRRDFLVASTTGMGMLLLPDWAFANSDAPCDDPAAHLELGWTGNLKWGNVVDVTKFQGGDWHEKLALRRTP